MISILVAGFIAGPHAIAQTSSFDPASFTLNLEVVVDGQDQPVQIVDPDDGTGRMFIVEQGGLVRILQDGGILETPLLDISDQVSRGSEQGLLSIALHPDFAENGVFFIDYTDLDGHTNVERWTISADDPNQADPESAEQILFVEQPYPNHNGGLLLFGPDNYLYVGLGDGGSQGDPNGNGQNLSTLLGKILRIDIDHADGDLAYSIPTDNPFVNESGAHGEIWTYGLRNPWRFSFDRETGDLYIGDVGQGEVEEADFAAAGESGLNFGWNTMEGPDCYAVNDCDPALSIQPFFWYRHSDGSGCSIVGGYVYRGEAIPELAGGYLTGDYCTGLLWAVNPQSGESAEPVATGLLISSFGERADGEIFVIDHSGAIYLVVP